jgi:hypothetical protein
LCFSLHAIVVEAEFLYTGVQEAATHHAGIIQVQQNTTAMSALNISIDGLYFH